MSDETPIIVWFRQDLRRADNPALYEASQKGKILPVYILDDENAGDQKMGAASRLWLHHSLDKLNKSMSDHLYLAKGDALKLLPEIAKKSGAKAVYWNRCYEPWRIDRDKKLKEDMKSLGLEAESFNASLLWEPWQIQKDDGTPYKVFTPFYRKGCLKHSEPREPLPAPDRLTYADPPDKGCGLEGLHLLPSIRWDQKVVQYWSIGEDGAMGRLDDFLDDGFKGYKDGRNYPAANNVSRLSPHLHWGEISPHQVWHKAKTAGMAQNIEKDLDHFLSELGWREFSYSLLYHFPKITWENLQEKFNAFPWKSQHSEQLDLWQKGQTGYPMVDAAMRELWETGYTHNRSRMIVGSFLVKHLLIHWHRGEKWFWDCLVDADLASNSASWQWIAGCGADAAPYFRIFNPITQGPKFDPDGDYVRRWVPEIAHLSDKQIFEPWNHDHGSDYPDPIVDHTQARERALEAFQSLKSA